MKRYATLLAVLVVLSMLLAACPAPVPPAAPPPAVEEEEALPVEEEEPPEEEEAPAEFKVAVIGKSVHPYWSNVEKGVIAAAEDMGLSADQAVFFVPQTEDVARQIETMETYIAQGFTGIAIAPSDPNALEPVMAKAADAGIFVTTLDTPPVDDSVSLVYIGTDNFTAGQVAGEAMNQLLPEGGLVGIGRGSDTALNALQRTDGFLDTASDTIETLEPVNDREDAARALELANSVISANPDLAGAFGVYAYNGPAWATAVKEADAVGDIKIVAFDATTDIIENIKEGVIQASIAQREFDMGYKSVDVIMKMAEMGVEAALEDMGAVDGVIDTGVDVVTPGSLLDYAASLDDKGIPYEWTVEGWEPPADAFVFEMPTEEEEEAADIVDTAIAAGSFNTLVAAVQAAGLEDALRGEGPFTVFAPTDDAFAALPEGTVDALLEDPEALAEILLYHVVAGQVMAADVSDGLEAETLQGAPVSFSVTDDGVMINEANIVATDVEASNGVIHVIDAVILPPSGEPAAMHPALEDGQLVVAWIPKALDNPVFELGKIGAEVKAAELTEAGPYEVVIEYMGSVASDMTEQAAVMADAVTRGVDAIGVSCNDPDGCIDPINDAITEGIEVMTWDSDSPDSGRFTYLGVDNYEGGLAAGELLVKNMGEEGKVAIMTGVPGAFNLEERIRGFTDYVADYPGIEIVTTVACNDDINLGVQVVEETMQANPDLDGWFFVGLWPLFADRGSMPLWEEAALAGMTTIVFDTLPVELEFLQDGYVQGLVGQKYWGWGYDTVQMIYDKIVNGAEYESFTNSGMDLVDECNVDVMAEMWETQDFTLELPPLCE